MLGTEVGSFGWPRFITHLSQRPPMFGWSSWRTYVPRTRKPSFLIYRQGLKRCQFVAMAILLDNAKEPASRTVMQTKLGA